MDRSLSASTPSSYSLSVSESSDGDEPPISYGADANSASEAIPRDNSFWRGVKQTLLFSWILRRPKVAYKHVSNTTNSARRTSTDSDISTSSSAALEPLSIDDGVPKRATFTSTLRHLLLSSSWLACLIVFVPIGAVSYLTNMPPALVFVTNAIAIVPLSALLTDATERIAKDAGDAVGALLNISLGNLVELIIFVALKNGQIRIVCASILGSVLVNLLPILGSALLACSMSGQQATYSGSGTQLLGSLLFVSVLAFLMPTAFDYTFQEEHTSKSANLNMSRVSSLIVLGIYILYILHELRSRRPSMGGGRHLQPEDEESNLPESRSRSRSPSPLVGEPEMTMRDGGEGVHGHPSRHVRFADEGEGDLSGVSGLKLTEVTEEGGVSHGAGDANASESRGRRPRARSKSSGSAYQQPSFAGSSRGRNRSHSGSAGVGAGRPSIESAIADRGVLMRSGRSTVRALRTSLDESHFPTDFLPLPEEGNPGASAAVTRRNKAMNMAVSIVVLVVSSALMSLNAEFLVSTIDAVTHSGGWLSESIIGLIILPIVGNMAEYITVVTVAVREKLDLAVAVSVGSSIQIALCVTPLTVLASWIMDREMILTFNYFEMSTLVGAVLLVNLIILGGGGEAADPAANSLKGALMCGCYAMIAIGAYLSP